MPPVTPYVKPKFSVSNGAYVDIICVNDCTKVIIKEWGQAATVEWLCLAPIATGADDKLSYGQATELTAYKGSGFRAGETIAKIKTVAGTADFTWMEL